MARLAGLPETLVKRACRILQHFESERVKPSSINPGQMSLFQVDERDDSKKQSSEKKNREEEEKERMKNQLVNKLITSLRDLEVQKLTPLEALNKLDEWQKEIS